MQQITGSYQAVYFFLPFFLAGAAFFFGATFFGAGFLAAGFAGAFAGAFAGTAFLVAATGAAGAVFCFAAGTACFAGAADCWIGAVSAAGALAAGIASPANAFFGLRPRFLGA